MLCTIVTVAALVATQLSGTTATTATGNSHVACSAENVCTAANTVCFYGTCLPCGKNGEPKCTNIGEEECSPGNIVNQDGWCSTYSPPHPEPSTPVHIKEECSAVNICEDPLTECWEGTCMPCGKNGKPRCTRGAECEPGNVVNREGWCTTYNAPHPEPKTPAVAAEGCSADTNCAAAHTVCFYATCKPCGKNGEPKCAKSGEEECETGNMVNKDGFCSTASKVHCGWINEQCCADDVCLDDGSVCLNGNCMRAPKVQEPEVHCGWLNEQCCENDVCLADGAVCLKGKCMVAPKVEEPKVHCGWINEQCCEHDVCLADNSKCFDGKCLHMSTPRPAPVPVLKHCGWINEQCCEHNVCLADNSKCFHGKCLHMAAPRPEVVHKKKFFFKKAHKPSFKPAKKFLRGLAKNW